MKMEVQHQLATSTVLPTIFNNDLIIKTEVEDPPTTSPSVSVFNNSSSPNESIKLSLSNPSSPTANITTSVSLNSPVHSQISMTNNNSLNNLKNGITKINSIDRKRPYPCNLCVSKFGSKMELEEHQNSHTGEKPFQCDICKSRFNRRSTLWNHKRIHSDNKPFVCTVCNMRFKWKNSLKCHKEMHMRKNESTVNMDDLKNVTYATAAKKNFNERGIENNNDMAIKENGSPRENIGNENRDSRKQGFNGIELSPINNPHEPINGFLNNNTMNNGILHYTTNSRFSHPNPLDIFESHHNIHTMLSPQTNNHLIINSLTNTNSPGDFDFTTNLLQTSNTLHNTSNNFDNCTINPTTSIFTHIENNNNNIRNGGDIGQYNRNDNLHNNIQTSTALSVTASSDGATDSLISNNNGETPSIQNNISLENNYNDNNNGASNNGNNDILLQSNLINGYANSIDTSLLYSNPPTSEYLTTATSMNYTTMPDISLISQANYNASLGNQRISLSDSLTHLNQHTTALCTGNTNIHDSDLISFSVSGPHTNGLITHNGIHMNALHPFNYPVTNVGMGTITLNGSETGGWHI
ncbi:Zinc finger, C2H2 domain and Zinc finger C2H2-type/integrase DNA-binding domain and Zinc finger, C2H2-like domain-containing protein [Strongyloides ratti]|uniref:Zinc finger, C2H2 domain and Zinc finger C2H2-type/integrase DNA-binding domain and Zinc finger, C2H2-like domain-containing protein n=1 Tax=Strongyloides ratti TaxID=34506 RepID=A0A090LIM9_STRRB|nr:Zinc finger, C2H2 domain and Zinc finger C2H2-type/integrase DNA-binding domain and Zinc finger, C2H2-like domain-containing protein [Strongyloides ratti]CEF69667.1 Zinc finger, C2H2 domain and Zinc finger C2H2-type/integrase DNA-binding domain and Zinc finger, C2H2-like domain-containing protein [Strongyloides ratti]